MDCKNISPYFIDFLDKKLDEEKTKMIQEHIEKCVQCQTELEQLSVVMEQMSSIKNEQPSEKIKVNFLQMLEGEKKRQMHLVRSRQLFKIPAMQIAASFLILITGILIGLSLNRSTDKDEMVKLQQEMSEVKQLLVFSKLDQQSASQRIQAVNYARDITTPDYQIINALIKTMNTDENTNVRMAAIQALSKFTEESIVLDALVSSLDKQTDPLLQITLINILVELKEERAVDAMKKLLEQEETHETVKKLAQKGLTII